MSLGDKLMTDHQERKDRDELLASAMTIGKLREIIKNIGTDRDDVPVVLSGEPLRVITSWMGEWRGPRPVFVLYEKSREDSQEKTSRAKGQEQGAH